MKKLPLKVLSTATVIGLSTITLGQGYDAHADTGAKPTITAPSQQVQYGKKWDPYENVKATDKEDGDLSKEVYYEPPYFTTTQPGTYHVKYGVWDTDDNNTETNRKVTVLEQGAQDSQPQNPSGQGTHQGGETTPSKPEQHSPSHSNPQDTPSTQGHQQSPSKGQEQVDSGSQDDGQNHNQQAEPSQSQQDGTTNNAQQHTNIDNGYNHHDNKKPIEPQHSEQNDMDNGYNHDGQGNEIAPSQPQNVNNGIHDTTPKAPHHYRSTNNIDQNDTSSKEESKPMINHNTEAIQSRPSTQHYTPTVKNNKNLNTVPTKVQNRDSQYDKDKLPESGVSTTHQGIILSIISLALGATAVIFGMKRRQSKQN